MSPAELSTAFRNSAYLIVGGGLAVLLSLIGLAFVLLMSRQTVPGRPGNGRRVLGIGSALFFLAGSVAVGVGLLSLVKFGSEKAGTVMSLFRKELNTFRNFHTLLAAQEMRALLAEPKRTDPKKLCNYEYRVWSQNGEDGMIAEVFRRIGATNRYFVEFGASNGMENNTVLLLRQGWSGLWIEGDQELVDKANEYFQPEVEAKKLTAMQSFITAENIEQLFAKANVPEEFDLLSIDIDRNDYYVWEKITHYKPRVVVIEYNPLFPPTMSWVIPYDGTKIWDHSSHTSASLKRARGTRRAEGLRTGRLLPERGQRVLCSQGSPG